MNSIIKNLVISVVLGILSTNGFAGPIAPSTFFNQCANIKAIFNGKKGSVAIPFTFKNYRGVKQKSTPIIKIPENANCVANTHQASIKVRRINDFSYDTRITWEDKGEGMIFKETMGECSSKYLDYVMKRYEKSYVVVTNSFRKSLSKNISKFYCTSYNQAVKAALIKALGGRP